MEAARYATEPTSDPGALLREATPADADFLSWAILAASRGHLPKGWFDIALAQPERTCLQFLQRLTTAPLASRWHYSRFLVVEKAACAVAALCAFRAADAYRVSPVALTQTAHSLGLGPMEQAQMWKRGAYLFSCGDRSADDNWVIESIATLPGHRNRGYTSMLLAKAIENGRSRGMKEAEVTVVIGNASAERTYLAAGFRCVSESRHADFETATGAIGQRRLVKVL